MSVIICQAYEILTSKHILSILTYFIINPQSKSNLTTADRVHEQSHVCYYCRQRSAAIVNVEASIRITLRSP